MPSSIQGVLLHSIPPAQSMPSLPLYTNGREQCLKPAIDHIDERIPGPRHDGRFLTGQRDDLDLARHQTDDLDLARHVCSCSDLSSLVGHGVCQEEIPELKHHLSLADINLENMTLIKSQTGGLRGYIKKMFSKKRKPSVETIDKKKLKKKRFKRNYEVL